MKSFADYMMEDASLGKKKEEEEPEKNQINKQISKNQRQKRNTYTN